MGFLDRIMGMTAAMMLMANESTKNVESFGRLAPKPKETPIPKGCAIFSITIVDDKMQDLIMEASAQEVNNFSVGNFGRGRSLNDFVKRAVYNQDKIYFAALNHKNAKKHANKIFRASILECYGVDGRNPKIVKLNQYIFSAVTQGRRTSTFTEKMQMLKELGIAIKNDPKGFDPSQFFTNEYFNKRSVKDYVKNIYKTL